MARSKRIRPPSPWEADGISTEWVPGYFDTDLPERARDAVRYAFAEYVSLAALEPKPAQGVDLGQFRLPVEFFIAYTFEGTPSHAEGRRLLALIDSQAVQP